MAVELLIRLSKKTYDYIRRRDYIPNGEKSEIKDAIINGTLLSKRCRKKMTNAEKFEEFFGIKVDEFAADPCDIADRSTICGNTNGCAECELYHFWEKQYRKKNKEKKEN